MNKLDRSALGEALAERVLSLARTTQRLQALEDYREPNDHVVGQPDAEAVLRRALLVLSSGEAFELARRITAGEQGPSAMISPRPGSLPGTQGPTA